MDVIERLVIQSHEENGHWLWDGGKNNKGYGQVRWEGFTWLVHRLAWQIFVGDCPPELDHECNVKNCFNPDHLRPLSHSENIKRADLPNRRKKGCPQGHRYTKENTTINKGKRYCRTCKRLDNKRRKEAKRKETSSILGRRAIVGRRKQPRCLVNSWR